MTRRATRIARRVPFTLLLAVITAYYLALLSNLTFHLFAPEAFGHAFGSMLEHMLRGDFGVDRSTIGYEAWTRDGRTFAYFGILPAVLRLLVIPFDDVRHADVARLSCLVAMVLYVACQLRALLLVHRSLLPQWRSTVLLAAVGVATVLSGPQLYLLTSAPIHHEALFWCAALGAGFNLVLLRAALQRGALRVPDLALLAGLAGLALNARVSVGLGLVLATLLLVAWTAWHRQARGPGSAAAGSLDSGRRCVVATLLHALVDPAFLVPVAVLAVFVAVAGLVNFERWGNPLSFADYRYYDNANGNPAQRAVIDNYGELNPIRIWISLLYYSTGIPYLLKAVPSVGEYLQARYSGVIAPPSSGLLTNPITVVLAAAGLWRLWCRRDFAPGTRALFGLALCGHAATVLVVLSAMHLTPRYRFDFAPFMTLAALLGYGAVSRSLAEAGARLRGRMLAATVAACLLGVASSHYMLIVYKVVNPTVPMEVRRALLPLAPFAHAAFDR